MGHLASRRLIRTRKLKLGRGCPYQLKIARLINLGAQARRFLQTLSTRPLQLNHCRPTAGALVWQAVPLE
jgi:hypothetical protein